MGLFKRKKVITVATQSVSLIEDTPNMIRDSVVSSVRMETDITPDLLTNAINGLGVKSRAMYRYAGKHYTYGLPEGTIEHMQVADTDVKVIIESELKRKVYIKLNIHAETDISMWAEEFLLNERDWNPETNIVGSPPEHSDKVVTFKQVQATVDNKLTLTYSFREGTVVTTFSEEVSTLQPMALSTDYYHVVYNLKGSKGEILEGDYYWFYNSASDKYPSLVPEYGTTEGKPYYPIVPIRQNNVNLTAESKKNTELYKTSKQTLNKVSLNFTDIGKNVHDNPDIEQVDHAYVVFACHIRDDSQAALSYLHEYFSYLHDKSVVGEDEWLAYQGTHNSSSPMYNTVKYADANLSWEISYLYTKKTLIKGNLGTDKPARRGFTVREFVSGANHDIGFGMSFGTEVLVLKRQVTPEDIEIVSVIGLTHESYIYKGKGVHTTLADSADDNGAFLIPININVAQNLGIFTHDALMYASMKLVLNSYDERKLKWYQTGIFRIVILVVSVVLAAYGFVEALNIASGLLAGTAVAGSFIAAFVLAVGISLTVSFAIEVIAKALPPELSAIIMIAAALIGISNSSYAQLAMNWSRQFVSITTKSIDFEMKDLMAEMEDYSISMEQQQEELEHLQDELNMDHGLNPFDLLYEDTTVVVKPELPEQFYHRTLNYADNSYLTLQYIEHFRENKVTVPSFAEAMQLITNTRKD